MESILKSVKKQCDGLTDSRKTYSAKAARKLHELLSQEDTITALHTDPFSWSMLMDHFMNYTSRSLKRKSTNLSAKLEQLEAMLSNCEKRVQGVHLRGPSARALFKFVYDIQVMIVKEFRGGAQRGGMLNIQKHCFPILRTL